MSEEFLNLKCANWGIFAWFCVYGSKSRHLLELNSVHIFNHSFTRGGVSTTTGFAIVVRH